MRGCQPVHLHTGAPIPLQLSYHSFSYSSDFSWAPETRNNHEWQEALSVAGRSLQQHQGDPSTDGRSGEGGRGGTIRNVGGQKEKKKKRHLGKYRFKIRDCEHGGRTKPSSAVVSLPVKKQIAYSCYS